MSLNCIVAFDSNYGISKNGKIPWYINEDLKHFKNITLNHVVVMGRKTFDSLPDSFKPLPNRINMVITNNDNLINCNKYNDTQFDNLYNTKDKINTFIKNGHHVFVIGGSDIYNYFQDSYDNMFITHIDKNFECDNSIKPPSFKYSLVYYSKKFISNNIKYRFLEYKKTTSYITDKYNHDVVYRSLVNKIMNNGESRNDRTSIGTISVFGNMIEFDISEYIPALSSKKLFWKSVIKELLWFLRGDTDAKILDNQGVKIWNGNSSKEAQNNLGLSHLEEGDCGPNYSFQWRHFGAEYKTCHDNYDNKGFDQIQYIENLLQNDKFSRRIILNGWNPTDLKKTVLPCCHVMSQYYVDNDNNLSCHMYQRSCDVFLGLPFNIFSYAILTHILAIRNNLKPKKLVISIGDTHIYKNHMNQVIQQLKNNIYSMSKIDINERIKDIPIEDITIDDFDIVGYFSNKSIPAPMAV